MTLRAHKFATQTVQTHPKMVEVSLGGVKAKDLIH